MVNELKKIALSEVLMLYHFFVLMIKAHGDTFHRINSSKSIFSKTNFF